MRKTLLAFCIYSLLVHIGIAQNVELDTLLRSIHKSANEDERLTAILALCEYHYNVPRDTLDKYAYEAYSLAKRSGDNSLLSLAALAKANDYFRWGWTDSCMALIEEVLPLSPFEKPETRGQFLKLQRLKAMSYGGKMNYPAALEILYDLVNKSSETGDSVAFAQNANTIASIALARNQPEEALRWTRLALQKTRPVPSFDLVSAPIMVNKASAFQLLDQWDSAIYFVNKGIELSKRTLNLPVYSTALQKKSNIELKSGNWREAEVALLEMIEARRQTGDQHLYIDDNQLLIDFYFETKQPSKVIQLAEEFLYGKRTETAILTNYLQPSNVNLRLQYFEALAKAYKETGNHEKYTETLERILEAKENFHKINSQEAIAEIQTKYEVQQKENTIIQQRLDLEIRQRWLYGILAGLAIVFLSSLVLIMSLRRRQKIKIVQLKEKERFQRQKAIMEAQEEERKRISGDLHDNLGAYAASISSNLAFIKPDTLDAYGQGAVKELQSNSKAMISELNDTIWALKKDSLQLTTILDRLKLFVQRISPSFPGVSVEFEESILQDHVLSAYQALNLYRIMQETINNSLRHAESNLINIKVVAKNLWEVSISDNGKGFIVDDVPPFSGNGLDNMKKRASESGWILVIQSGGSATGTTVRITSTTI